MYKVLSPFLGFENCQNLSIKKDDDFFSSLILEKEEGDVEVKIVNINYINQIALNYTIDDLILKNLNITSQDDVEVYFCVVLQNPIQESIVNLIAPIIVNKKDKTIGQYITHDPIPKVFATLKEISS